MLRKCTENDIGAIYDIYFHCDVNDYMNSKEKPFKVDKKGFGNMTAWLCLKD